MVGAEHARGPRRHREPMVFHPRQTISSSKAQLHKRPTVGDPRDPGWLHPVRLIPADPDPLHDWSTFTQPSNGSNDRPDFEMSRTLTRHHPRRMKKRRNGAARISVSVSAHAHPKCRFRKTPLADTDSGEG